MFANASVAIEIIPVANKYQGVEYKACPPQYIGNC